MTDPLVRLTREVAQTLGEGPSAARRQRQRAAVARLTRAAPARRAPGAWWLVPLAAALVLALLVAREPARPAALSAATAEQSVMVGDWLAAPEREALVVDFSDRSRAALAAGSAARLLRLDPARVELNLERGGVTLDVHAAPDRDWLVRAGPFTVALREAQLRATWTPETGALAVDVLQGSAEVTRGADTTRVIAGQQLELRDPPRAASDASPGTDPQPHADTDLSPGTSSSNPTLTDLPPATSAANPTRPADLPPATPSADPTRATDLPATSSADPTRPTDLPPPSGSDMSPKTASHDAPPPSSPPARRPAWMLLAEAGDHRGALAAAELLGYERLLATLDVAALDLLARSARFASDAPRAVSALLALRRRFPADPRARTAAFLLGRVALDLEADPARARDWFNNYLSEAPGGPLAEEARRRVDELTPGE